MQKPAPIAIDEALWQRALAREASLPAPYAALLEPPGRFVLGRIAQSLDGRIATESGHSFWISGQDDILHTHRLRALFDVVLVGAATVRADDPLLTTRLCPGPSPTRVIVDPDRRLTEGLRVFRDGPPTILVCGHDADCPARLGHATILPIPRDGAGGLAPAAILDALAANGLNRVFIEGGGLTVSRFLAAGMLNRLHVTIAPILLGAGIPAFTLPGVPRADHAQRVSWTVHNLGDDLLLDIPLP